MILVFHIKGKKTKLLRFLRKKKKKTKKLGVRENPERKREGWVKLYYIHTFRKKEKKKEKKKKKKAGKFGLRSVMVLYRVMIVLMLAWMGINYLLLILVERRLEDPNIWSRRMTSVMARAASISGCTMRRKTSTPKPTPPTASFCLISATRLLLLSNTAQHRCVYDPSISYITFLLLGDPLPPVPSLALL